MKKIIALLVALLMVCTVALAEEYVIDSAGIFTAQEIAVMGDLVEHIQTH